MQTINLIKKLLQANKIKKYANIIIMAIVAIFISFALLVAVVSSLFTGSSGTYGAGEIPPAVKQWQPQIEAELEKYGRKEHINVLLAITTQESGGTASLDIMQASESLGLAPNTIQDPLYSIEVGVRYFDEVMTQAENAEVDVDTAIQAYNMGNGYIDFVSENGGEHTKDLAQQFSDQMKSQLGWNVYGDPNYVENVKQYMGNYSRENVGAETEYGILQHPYIHLEPAQYLTSSEFGIRVHPIYGTRKLHAGIDLAPIGSEALSIASSAEGVVDFAGYHSTAGNMVRIRHDGYLAQNGEVLYTVYMHLAQPSSLKTSQIVEKGDIIGLTGTSGGSTGVHLHFEVHEGYGNQVNPRKYIAF